MNCSISSIHYCPVKSLSFQSIKSCIIKKNLGMLNDRVFAFSRGLDYEKAKLIEKNPNERKLNYFLTLKNSPLLNKYKFHYYEKELKLYQNNLLILSISSEDKNKYDIICDKLIEFEKSLSKPIYLLKNEKYLFFDTTHSNKVSNSISLININSIEDFKKQLNESIEFDRFRGNLYINGLDAWEEINWINKIITINKVPFMVTENIPRCSATNLKPNTDKFTINLPVALKRYYNHIYMGVYITPLGDGVIKKGDKII